MEVYVEVLDENDNNPYFLPDPRVLVVPENTEVGRKIAVLEAYDADSGEFGKITYLLDRLSSEVLFGCHKDFNVVARRMDVEESVPSKSETTESLIR